YDDFVRAQDPLSCNKNSNLLSLTPNVPFAVPLGEQVRQPQNFGTFFARLPDLGVRNPEEIAAFLPGCRTSGLETGTAAGICALRRRKSGAGIGFPASLPGK
ncbi:MAG: hypothetical protein IJS62_05615, partial [Bacteroidales bacterium]|nr:hypothetical protein [Bacteroidales bacterium]